MEIVDSSVLPAELFFIPFIFSLPLSLPSSVRSYGHWIAASGRDDNTEPAGGSRGSFFFLSLSLDWRGGGKFSLLLLPTKDTFDELPANGCVNACVCVWVCTSKGSLVVVFWRQEARATFSLIGQLDACFITVVPACDAAIYVYGLLYIFRSRILII